MFVARFGWRLRLIFKIRVSWFPREQRTGVFFDQPRQPFEPIKQPAEPDTMLILSNPSFRVR
jgi:hypothetical protein